MVKNRQYFISAFFIILAIVLGIRSIQRIVILSHSTSSTPEASPKKLAQSSVSPSLTQLHSSPHKSQEVDKLSKSVDSTRIVNASQSTTKLIPQAPNITTPIQDDESPETHWQKALNLASLAIEIERSPRPSIDTWQQAQSLWKQALHSFRQIPANSSFKAKATPKIKLYEQRLAIATQKLNAAQTNLLKLIVQQSDLSDQATISICKLPQNCRHWRGNQLIPRPASLSKIPIAIALLHKIKTEKINLNTPIYVSPKNYTEDSNAKIQVGRRYPLKTLLMEMITHSSNIAGNQLIDYLGWDYINSVLKKRGYHLTRIGSKFIGERIVPANLAKGGTVITSNDLSRMLMEAYNHQHPGDEILIEALNQQHNRYLGFSALETVPARWLGEKTGESSTVQGTTLAFKLAGETYIVTAIDRRGYREANLRRCLIKLVNYIAHYGYF